MTLLDVLTVIPDVLAGTFVLAMGAVVGSFLNVVVHRMPRGESVVTPRSRCPSCATLIRWNDNIPVLSWIFLGRRCRSCGAPIAWRYPAVEALNALLWLGAFLRFDSTLDLVAAVLFASSMVALAFIDLEHYILPDRITLPGVVVGFCFSPFVSWSTPLSALAGAVAGAGILLFVMGAYWLVRRAEGMGMGDVKMLAMVGAFLGWKGMLLTLFIGVVLGAAVGLSLVVLGWAGERAVEEGEGEGFGLALPFGTFLAVAALAALFLGPWPVDVYLELSGLTGE